MILNVCRLVLSRNHIDLTTVVSSICQTGNLLSDVLKVFFSKFFGFSLLGGVLLGLLSYMRFSFIVVLKAGWMYCFVRSAHAQRHREVIFFSTFVQQHRKVNFLSIHGIGNFRHILHARKAAHFVQLLHRKYCD